MVRARLLVSGRVQGVGYRYLVREKAQSRRLRGFVRNLADGRVEIVLEGPEEDVTGFVEEDVPGVDAPVRVDGFDAEYSEAEEGLEGFSIGVGDLAEELVEGFGTGMSYLEVMRGEMKEGFGSVHDEIHEMRGESREGLGSVHDEIHEMRGESREGLGSVRREIGEGFSTMDGKYGAVSETLTDLREDFKELVGIIRDFLEKRSA